MYGKLLIECKMTLLTGMHIGGSSTFSAIGAVDSPVVRDAYTSLPMVPGSSLKGKMRYLLAKATCNTYQPPAIAKEPATLTRLFGSAGNDRLNQSPKTARLQFSDCFMLNGEDMLKTNGVTEVKFENTINRATAVANPRQIERVIRNACFQVRLMYDAEEAAEATEDMQTLAHGLKLLSMDYLGGHGSRGYGRIRFSDVQIRALDGDVEALCEQAKVILKDVEQYAIFAS